ncbi:MULTISPECIES: DUF418 domain-containing protein [Stenotrophomonas]|uniref:DUF418 domain-containing protein n=1 Tax=Stenotrophomonas TaxID=40323 RepID=UPI001CF1F4FD|nr:MULTISPECIES: DUF418 domain-containing protein [Stenotrophomonas]MCA7022682.1 DUF418 domain-containing protein [Stenotrophomonas acidaminiphila]MCE4075122.1 DUF418 domain-containing protein [Stenotrophomonas acidaminiphila]
MSNATFQPIAPDERIATLDVLRGLALLGILLMNMEAFVGPLDLSTSGIDPHWQGVDRWADAFVYIFVQGKFFTLFSLLFGAGFAVMAQRAEVAGRDFTRFYLRRSLGLLGIGLVHALLLWSGDILVVYALLSFLLLAFREAPRAWLPVMGVLAYLAAIGLMLLLGALMLLVPDEVTAAQATHAQAAIEAQRQAYGHGTYGQAVLQRLRDFGASLGALLVVGPQVLGMFLIGSWFARSGAIAHPDAHQRLFTWLRRGALPLGLALMLACTWYQPWLAPGRFDLRSAAVYGGSALAGLLMCLGYLAWGVRWSHALRWLAPAGRMALSNYLGQSLVCTLLFYGYGLGWFEQMGRAWQLLFAVALFAAQVALGRAWLRHFRFGPMEWLWRAITYWRWPPLRRDAAGAPQR